MAETPPSPSAMVPADEELALPTPAVAPCSPSSPSSSSPSPSAFERLPDEIIQQILQLTDPNSFASLVLLNSRWRRISQQPHLYAFHLSRCDSYAASHHAAAPPSATDDDLPRLRRLFAREVKRNLFEAYLRPRRTTIKLISNSISSSSAPGGEGMQFSPSPCGHHVLAYNSSRIYVIDVRGPELAVERELKILRRPASACILDDASLLAVLSTDMQVDVYDLGQVPPRRKQSLILDNAPRAIALSPCGRVLAAAYEGGIEVSSINPGALPTDRRSVKCDGVDSLAFSLDGTQLLGTTTTSYTPNTVILTAPYYDPGSQMAEDNMSSLWTTSILFPNTSRDCSHAVLLQEASSVEATWTFTYDRSFETFRAVRIDDLRNGTTYFTGPVPTAASPGPLLPCTLPSASYQGELVSAGFEGKDVWLYGIPEDLEALPENNNTGPDSAASPSLHRRSSGLSVRSPARIQETNGCRVPQWQILCDKFRNTFVSGRKVTELCGVSNVKWVSGFGNTSLQERLIIAARGVLPPKPISEEDGIDFVDGGRMTILDFDYSPSNGRDEDITIEVGTMQPEVLEEEHRDIDTEVAIVRRRTVAQRRGNRGGGGVMRAATSANRQVEALLRPQTSHGQDSDDPLVPRPMMTARNHAPTPASDELEDASLEEAQEALDAPYAHASPRSGTTLRRAATAAAVNRQRNPPPPVAGPVEYRRANGRAEHPHESDADNWVPPPPPYSKEDPGVDLPAFLRHSAISGAGSTTITAPGSSMTSVPAIPPVPPIPHTVSASNTTRPELPRLRTSPAREGRFPRSWNPSASSPIIPSDPSTSGQPPVSAPGISHRPMSSYSTMRFQSHSNYDDEDIYDVSPVGSPLQAVRSHMSVPAMAPERPSAEAFSSTAEYTPASSSSYAFPEGSHQRVANMNTSTPSVPSYTTVGRSNNEETAANPAIRRLSNAQTWPRAPHVPTLASTSVVTLGSYPRSAPATNFTDDSMIGASLPPAPHPEQLARLHSRQSIVGAPRRASGAFQFPHVPLGNDNRDGQNTEVRHFNATPEIRQPPTPDQPLIISTPTGISGAYDIPSRPNTASNTAEMVLHAPVPRHPRPSSAMNMLRPTVERLENISRNSSVRGEARNHRSILNMLGTPPAQLTPSSLRHHTSLTRRQSRARRGAMKNMQDAKVRGWTGRKKNKKLKDNDAASVAGWTDITLPPNDPKTPAKEKKCVIM
ncbi:hypothetical protein F5X96DRAFT_442920 [Biscogniauxia mediterranea]|nr:hypothetical protein F5X96DRAFT_442920 [Biscogniauxia mediterranea]